MKLKNISGGALKFKTLDNFVAPEGLFECPDEIAEQLLNNDAIRKVKQKITKEAKNNG